MALWLRNLRRPVYTRHYPGGRVPPGKKWRCEDDAAARLMIAQGLMREERGPGRPRKSDTAAPAKADLPGAPTAGGDGGRVARHDSA